MKKMNLFVFGILIGSTIPWNVVDANAVDTNLNIQPTGEATNKIVSTLATTDDGFTYSLVNNTIMITDYSGPTDSVSIPANIDGYPVTKIDDFAFYSKSLTGSLSIPNTVTSIGTYAFAQNSITGLLTIPESVTSIGAQAFLKNNINAVTINSTVLNTASNSFRMNQIATIVMNPTIIFPNTNEITGIFSAQTIPAPFNIGDSKIVPIANLLTISGITPSSYTSQNSGVIVQNNDLIFSGYSSQYKFNLSANVAAISSFYDVDMLVQADYSSITAKDSVISLNENWIPQDNFVSARTSSGESILLGQTVAGEKITVAGTVDTKSPGVYPITYSIGSATITINVTVEQPLPGADVTAKYQDERGNKIAEDIIKSGNIGDSYTTDQLDISGYTFKGVQGNITGQFTNQVQSVVYIYERSNAAPVTVRYEDEQGNELATPEALNGKIGLPYQSQEKSISGYTIKVTPTNASGLFTDQPQEVVYIYERSNAAPVTVKYEDESGNELATPEELNGKIGLSYQSQAKSISGYTVKVTPTNARGLFTDQPQEVVYIYERSNAAPVTVKYEDESGNELATPEELNGKIGLPYQSQAKSISGYTVKVTPTNASGLFTDQPQEVVFIYERSNAAPVTVKYEDESGNELATPEELNGKIGLPYQSQAKSVSGYTVKVTPTNASGLFTDQPQEVVYIYERSNAAPVTVRYEDEQGNELFTPDILSGKIGLSYQAQAKVISGYTVKIIPTNITGLFTENPQTVLYIYTKSKVETSVGSDNAISSSSKIKDDTNDSESKSQRQQKNLPQTGEHQEFRLVFIGGFILFVGAIFNKIRFSQLTKRLK